MQVDRPILLYYDVRIHRVFNALCTTRVGSEAKFQVRLIGDITNNM